MINGEEFRGVAAVVVNPKRVGVRSAVDNPEVSGIADAEIVPINTGGPIVAADTCDVFRYGMQIQDTSTSKRQAWS